MAKKLLVQIDNIFKLMPFLYLIENDEIKPIQCETLDNLKEVILDKIQNEQVEEIIFNGNANFIKGLIEKEGIFNTNKYSNRNVRIYINDEIFN